MTAPGSQPKPDRISKAGARVRPRSIERSLSGGRLALLLDLSGDRRASSEWAEMMLPGCGVQPLDKTELKWGSKREALAHIRSLGPDALAVFTNDLRLQSARGSVMLFAVLAGASRVLIGDRGGRLSERTRAGVLLIEAPRLALELLLGFALLIPLSWLFTLLLGAALRLRDTARGGRAIKRGLADPSETRLTALYIRATLASAAEGGMATHVEGFASGAESLGHRLKMIESGMGAPTSAPDAKTGASRREHFAVRPCALVSATKSLFELWNNLVFTFKSLRLVFERAGGADFIYQRYSRFNWTGVALSIVTGLPLALEFNGSEVWVSQRWDPVGQVWLLKRFERLNLRAADLIFVVSEVEKRSLTRSGVDPGKIRVNPNGVSADKFHPGCGGSEVRRSAGLEAKIVVGFVGTFGPWHGAPVLAEAARELRDKPGYHFIFIGDGEQRGLAESIIGSGGGRNATFAGRVEHARVPACLDACDILASPHVAAADGSEFFGSPTKLFEYLATGRPVIASRLGQIADIIIDGENGLLVEPGNAHALAAAIERLAGDPGLRARLGAAGRQTVIDRFTWRHNAARVFDSIRKEFPDRD